MTAARLILALLAVTLPASAQEPLRVFLRAGPKTHGPGEHDHPRFLEEWTALLRERGCTVAGALEFPRPEDLARTDVLVMYAAEAGSVHGDERIQLEAFLGGGGGIVVLHDALTGDDPEWFQRMVGGAWEHGQSKWHEGLVGSYFTDTDHPITAGVANFELEDEIYWDLHLEPDVTVLANGYPTIFEIAPEMWTYEGPRHRAFVSILGHEHATFSHAAYRTLLLRGIAWAGGRDVDSLTTPDEVAGLAYPEGGPTAPERAHEGFALHPDFEASLVAAEPLVVNPVSLDWDANGRMWVALTPSYPFRSDVSGIPPHDEIAILEDADGDGRMDGKTVFAGDLDLVTSLVHHEDGVIATQAPDILFLRDTDADDRADARETLFTGFGTYDTHAVISNLRWGIDGWIYATQGYSGSRSNDVRGADGRSFGPIRNGIFRFRADGSAIEQVVAYGSNTWGLDFDAAGELFFTMANGSHLRHVVIEDAALARGRVGRVEGWKHVPDHRQAFPAITHERQIYAQIDFVGGFTAASGSLVYSGGAWPVEYWGNHFVCEPTLHLVHRCIPESDGGLSYVSRKPREAEFLTSTDPWFRPVHLRTGPDGAVYVLDFYNQAIVHNDPRGPRHSGDNSAVRPDRDANHGRIWRVDHRRKSPATIGPPGQWDDERLESAFEHPNRWHRMTAQRLIRERGGGLFVPSFAVQLRRAMRPLVRLHAMWTLDQLGALPDHQFLGLLGDRESFVRRNAARIVADRAEPSRGPDEFLTAMLARETNPRVRLALAAALADSPVGEASAAILVQAWGRADDDWTRSAVLAALSNDPNVSLREAISYASDPRMGRLVEILVPRFVASATIEEVGGLVSSLPSVSYEAAQLAVLRPLVDALPEDAPRPERTAVLDEALDLLLRDSGLDVAIAVLPLASRWREGPDADAAVDALAGRLQESLVDSDDPELRLACLRTLLALPRHADGAAAAAVGFFDPAIPVAVRAEVARRLGETGSDAAVGALLDAYPGSSGAARDAVFEELARSPASAGRILDRVESGDWAPADLGIQRSHRLRTHPDAAVAGRAAELLDRLAGPREEKDALIARLLPQVAEGGDAARGRDVYIQNCGTCHVYRNDGREVGPDLTGMGAHGVAELLPFVIDPNRAVEGSYVEYVAQDHDDLVYAGVLARDSADSILLKNAEGEVEVARSDLAVLKSTGRSPMPEGFEELGVDALRDLFAYLTAEYEGYRVVDLDGLGTRSAEDGLFADERAQQLRFEHYGILDVEGVPFELLDPARTSDGDNAIVLRGGMNKTWPCWTEAPAKVEIPVGFALERMHVLSGIGGWAYPYISEPRPVVRWTWRYADGELESVLLENGVEFADWIRRSDVPGSRFVPSVVEPGSNGQVRVFDLAPSRTDVAVESILLESLEPDISPVFLALTAQLASDGR